MGWGPVAEAERAGFEPATHLAARTRFPVALLRPLGHLSRCRRSVPPTGRYGALSRSVNARPAPPRVRRITNVRRPQTWYATLLPPPAAHAPRASTVRPSAASRSRPPAPAVSRADSSPSSGAESLKLHVRRPRAKRPCRVVAARAVHGCSTSSRVAASAAASGRKLASTIGQVSGSPACVSLSTRKVSAKASPGLSVYAPPSSPGNAVPAAVREQMPMSVAHRFVPQASAFHGGLTRL